MRSWTLLGLAVCLIGPMSVGCTNTQGIVRGQSPAGPERSGVMQAGGFVDNTSGGIEQIGYHHQGYGYGQPPAITSSLADKMGVASCNSGACASDGAACPSCGDCSGGCRGGCRRQKVNGAWYPTHHHWHQYTPPQGLVYPPSNIPPAVIVYPYYTHKGPDDFFKAH